MTEQEKLDKAIIDAAKYHSIKLDKARDMNYEKQAKEYNIDDFIIIESKDSMEISHPSTEINSILSSKFSPYQLIKHLIAKQTQPEIKVDEKVKRMLKLSEIANEGFIDQLESMNKKVEELEKLKQCSVSDFEEIKRLSSKSTEQAKQIKALKDKIDKYDSITEDLIKIIQDSNTHTKIEMKILLRDKGLLKDDEVNLPLY